MKMSVEANNFAMCFMCQNTFERSLCEPLELDGLNKHDVVFCPTCLKDINLDIFLVKLMKNPELYDKVRAYIYQYLRDL